VVAREAEGRVVPARLYAPEVRRALGAMGLGTGKVSVSYESPRLFRRVLFESPFPTLLC
jgi:hypothetical protein